MTSLREVPALLAAVALVLPICAANSADLPRRTSFNEGWRFFKGEADGAEKPDFDDAKWLALRLPHDWAIEGPFDPKINPHTGSLPAFGTGWYRKRFTLPETARGKYVAIEFDGAMSNSDVWLNGHHLGGRPYGYIGFELDLTPYFEFGDRANVLAVRLRPEPNSSRWYPGAGIYRNTWLNVTNPVHVAHWGTYVTTPTVTTDQAAVAVRADVVNNSNAATTIDVKFSVLDEKGTISAQASVPVTLAAGETRSASIRLAVKNPVLWDIEHPALYLLITEIAEGSKTVDRYTTPFGIRTVVFSPTEGLLLNGRHLKLHGVCDHHDLGALGAAVNSRAIERQVRILQAAGVNAIRTSHNPPAPELLEMADQMGLLVMDEAFDVWRVKKVANDYHKYFDQWSERDARDMIRRDRNHPSVILWSIGNEVMEQWQPDGAKEGHRLVAIFHDEDPTRPTTSAFNGWDAVLKNKLADEVDIPGFNYAPAHYEEILEQHPGWVIFGSETESCTSSRGVYHLPLEKYAKHPSLQLSSYDFIAAPWAYCPDVEFAYQDRLPQLLGEFVWTGFDYIGEPTPYFWSDASDTGVDLKASDWPARSSYFGMIDLAGFPKDRYYLYQSEWTTKPMVHVLPHWNWQGREGQPIPVMVYSNAETVELFLNGKSLGRKARYSDSWNMPVAKSVIPSGIFRTKYRRIWQVPYEPGSLRAIAYQGGRWVAADEVKTAGAPAKLRLLPDFGAIRVDLDDLAFITVRVEDRDGNLCPEANPMVHFRVSEGGEIAGVDNGSAASVESFKADHHSAFNGLALVIVRPKAGTSGAIQVSASAEGLATGQATIRTTQLLR